MKLNRTVALVGMMGAGKTSIGKRLAAKLGVPFADADHAIEEAADMTVKEIFAKYGEPEFRRLERSVIARLLGEAPHVLATGGGAFMNDETRALIKEKAVSIWLKADIDTLARRVARKDTRPLLKGKDAKTVLNELAAVRYPIYAEADITVESGDVPHQVTVDAILKALAARAETPA